MLKAQYLLDNDWVQARERLTALEEQRDPWTIEYLANIGVDEGWYCLEIGGGGGSIAEWLCQRVGSTGRVMAADINIRFLNGLDYPNLEVLEHNAVTDDLDTDAFDLVHARSVLFHMPEREVVLRKMADAVKPGGWILVEEPDFITRSADPLVEDSFGSLHIKVHEAMRLFTKGRGNDHYFGAQLFGMLRSFGFESLKAQGRTRMVQGGTPEAEFDRLTLEQFRKSIVAAGRVTEQEIDECLDLLGEPSFSFRGPLTMSAWGRKPTA